MLRSKLLISSCFVLALSAGVFSAAPASAAALDALKGTVLENVRCAATGEETVKSDVRGQTGTEYKVAPPCGLCDLIQVAVNVSNMIVAISGAVAVLIFVYAGLMYLTVTFKQDNYNKAKSSMTAAIVGLGFIFGGYVIINFVILTFVGGTAGMAGPFKTVTGQTSWGVCEGYETGNVDAENQLQLKPVDDVYYNTN